MFLHSLSHKDTYKKGLGWLSGVDTPSICLAAANLDVCQEGLIGVVQFTGEGERS